VGSSRRASAATSRSSIRGPHLVNIRGREFVTSTRPLWLTFHHGSATYSSRNSLVTGCYLVFGSEPVCARVGRSLRSAGRFRAAEQASGKTPPRGRRGAPPPR